MNYQGTRQISGLSPGAIISTVLPVLPTDRSAASLSMAGFGNAFTPDRSRRALALSTSRATSLAAPVEAG